MSTRGDEVRTENGRGLRVVVVGAGIVGSTLAFYLSRRGTSVTVVEAHQPCSGASGHSFAYLNAFDKLPAHYYALSRRSMELWDRMARLLDRDIGLRWGGRLLWESTPEGAKWLEGLVEQFQALGYPTRLVDVTEMRVLEPHLDPGPVTAAALNESEGQVEPPLVVQACLDRARDNGAKVQTDARVTGLSSGDSRIRAVRTTRGDIPCDVVVLAAGVATTEIASMAGVDVPQEESPGVVVRTAPRPPLVNSVIYAPSVDDRHPEIHLRQAADGHLMIGEGTQESLARDDSSEHAEDLLERATRYFPALAGAKAIPVPVGYRPMPADELPILGFTKEVENLYIALMHSGVTLAAVVAELSTIEIADGTAVEALDPYRLERFAPGDASARRPG